MLVRVKMIGKGVPGDSFRAPLPNYHEVFTHHEEGYVIAIIPDDDYHEEDGKRSGKYVATGHGPMLIELPSDHHKKWHDHLATKYKDRGEFKPEVR